MVLFCMITLNNAVSGPDVCSIPGEQAFLLADQLPQGAVRDAGFPVGPHVHPDTLQIILAISGDCSFTIDGEHHEVEAPCLITVPGGGVHAFEVGPGVSGWAATIAHHRVLDLVVNRSLDMGFLLRRSHIVGAGIDPARIRELAASLRDLCREWNSGQEGRDACIEALQRIVLIQVMRLIRLGQEADVALGERDRELFLAFRALVERQFVSERRTTAYVAALKCTNGRLNRACMRFAGLSAKGVILDRLADEAKRQLVFTSSSATRIGYALGFAEPSYFVRFFRRQTGTTPSQFRNASRSRPASP